MYLTPADMMVSSRIRHYRVRDWQYYKKLNDKYIFLQLALAGLYVDELVKLNDETILSELIDRRYVQDQYETLKNHESKKVRLALARNGYFPDYFILDNDEDIKAAVIINHPSYIKHIIGKHDKHSLTIYNALVIALGDELNPNLEHLEKFIKQYPQPKFNDDYVEKISDKALQIKLNADKKPKTDKSRYELYRSFDERYAQTMTALQVDSLLYLQDVIGHSQVRKSMIDHIIEVDALNYMDRYDVVNRIINEQSLYY